MIDEKMATSKGGDESVSVSSVPTVRLVYTSAARTTAPAAIWAFTGSATTAWTT